MNIGHADDFYKRMQIVCMAIPAGKVATYGQIAVLCGNSKKSRQVGYALKNNKVLLTYYYYIRTFSTKYPKSESELFW